MSIEKATTLTNRNSTWEEWYSALKEYVATKDGSVADADAWREGYDAGRTPAEDWFEAWGE